MKDKRVIDLYCEVEDMPYSEQLEQSLRLRYGSASVNFEQRLLQDNWSAIKAKYLDKDTDKDLLNIFTWQVMSTKDGTRLKDLPYKALHLIDSFIMFPTTVSWAFNKTYAQTACELLGISVADVQVNAIDSAFSWCYEVMPDVETTEQNLRPEARLFGIMNLPLMNTEMLEAAMQLFKLCHTAHNGLSLFLLLWNAICYRRHSWCTLLSESDFSDITAAISEDDNSVIMEILRRKTVSMLYFTNIDWPNSIAFDWLMVFRMLDVDTISPCNGVTVSRTVRDKSIEIKIESDWYTGSCYVGKGIRDVEFQFRETIQLLCVLFTDMDCGYPEVARVPLNAIEIDEELKNRSDVHHYETKHFINNNRAFVARFHDVYETQECYTYGYIDRENKLWWVRAVSGFDAYSNSVEPNGVLAYAKSCLEVTPKQVYEKLKEELPPCITEQDAMCVLETLFKGMGDLNSFHRYVKE